eukprot:GHVH01000851.1.p1 GENE.GHVH01000851.1~~GHVH01000851.1.p1  ORF type:complete len:221 (+),score=26.54 GHVH01000851.1:31-663(+)
MANRTDPSAKTIKGQNPQFLLARIVRNQIQQSIFWKERCFGLAADTLIDEACRLEYVAGTYGGFMKASPFLSLLLKMLQIEMQDEIIMTYLHQEPFKYLRCLAAFYIRMTSTSQQVWSTLEPFLSDHRKIRSRGSDGSFEMISVDVFVDRLLTDRMVCTIELPAIISRINIEKSGFFDGPRESVMIEAALEQYEIEKSNPDMNYGPPQEQ